MKNIDYKLLKRFSGLPKYDVGSLTPDKIKMSPEEMLALENSKIDFKMPYEIRNEKYAKMSAAADKVMGGISAGLGALSFAQQLGDTSTFTANDLMNMQQRSSNTINGVGYEEIGPLDRSATDRQVKSQNRAATMQNISQGAAVGSQIGGLVGPVGKLVGGVGGAIVGGIGSIFGNKKRKKKYEEALRVNESNTLATNTQNQAEASSQAVANEFYYNADAGLRPNFKNPNALVGGGEIVSSIKNGKITSAKIVPGKERVDDFPIRLDNGSTKKGVLGNKLDPYTGERLAVEGRPLAAAINDPNIKNKKPYKDALKYLFDLQDVTPFYDGGQENMQRKRIPQYNFGRRLPMFDLGSAYAILPGAINYANNLAGLIKTKKEPILVNDSYQANNNINLATSMMPTSVDVNRELEGLNDVQRLSQYAINQSNMSQGMRQAMLSNLYNNRMRNTADIYQNKVDRENQLKQQFANFLYTSGEADAQRRQQARLKYNEDYRQALAAKRKLEDTRRAGMTDAVNKTFANLFNKYMFDKNVELWYEDLKKDNPARSTKKANKKQKPTTGPTLFLMPTLDYNWKPTVAGGGIGLNEFVKDSPYTLYGKYSPYNYLSKQTK